jgi:hypothetical protein
MTTLMIWLIGWLFSCAYIGIGEAKGWERFLCSGLLFIGWPIMLGSWLREKGSSHKVITETGNQAKR